MAMVTLRARLDFLFPDNPLCWPGFLTALPAGAARQAERWLAAALRVPALGVDRAADSAATDVGLFAEICRWIDGAHAAVDRARLARPARTVLRWRCAKELVLAYKVMVEGEEKLVQLSATERKAMQEFVRGQQEQQAAVKGAAGATDTWKGTLAGVVPTAGSASEALSVMVGGLGAVTLAAGAAGLAVKGFTEFVAAGRERGEMVKTSTALTGSAALAEGQMRHWEEFSLHADFGAAALARSAAQMELFGLDAQVTLPSVARAADALGVNVEEMSQAVNAALLGQTRGLKRYGIDAQAIARETGIQVEGAGKLTRDQMEQVVAAITRQWDTGLADTADTIDDHLQHIENRFTVFAGRAFHDTAEGPINDFLQKIEDVLDVLDQTPEKVHAATGPLGFGAFGAYAVPTYMGQQGAEAAPRTGGAHLYDAAINVGPALNGLITPSLPGVTDQDLRDNTFQAYLEDQAKGAEAARKHAAALKDEADMAAQVAQSFRALRLRRAANGQRAFVPAANGAANGQRAPFDAAVQELPCRVARLWTDPFDAVGRKSPAILEAEEVQKQTAALEDLGFDHFTAVGYAKEQVAADVAERRAQIEEAHQARILSVHKGTVAAITQVEMTGIAVLERGTSMLFAHRSKAEKDRVSNAKLASMEMQALVLDEVSNELMTQAKKWAIEGAVHIVTPGKQAQGAAELAGALAAGAGAGVFSGLAGNIRAREQELAQSARDQAGLGTPGQSQAERDFYNRNSGGGGSFYTPSSPQSGGTTTISVVIQASYFTGTRADADRVVQDIKGALDEAVGRGELPHVQRAA